MEIAVPHFALDKCAHVCVCVYVRARAPLCRWMCDGDKTFTHISPLTYRLSKMIFNALSSYSVQILIATKTIYF